MKISSPLILCALTGLLVTIAPGRIAAAELSVQLENPPTSGTVALVLFSSANTFGDLRDPAKLETYTLGESNNYVLTDIPPANMP